MSRQSKNANRRTLARAITALHLKGEKGPASTSPKHGKSPAKRAYSRVNRTPNAGKRSDHQAPR